MLLLSDPAEPKEKCCCSLGMSARLLGLIG
jgi:hypothetical protein